MFAHKLIGASLVLATAASLSHAADPTWTLKESIDKMTDKRDCQVAGSGKYLLLMLSGDHWIVAAASPVFLPTAGRTATIMQARVDRNPPSNLTINGTGDARFGEITPGDDLYRLLTEMQTGASLLLRMLSPVAGMVEDEIHLDGYRTALADRKACLEKPKP